MSAMALDHVTRAARLLSRVERAQLATGLLDTYARVSAAPRSLSGLVPANEPSPDATAIVTPAVRRGAPVRVEDSA